jgi:hypothetical protein
MSILTAKLAKIPNLRHFAECPEDITARSADELTIRHNMTATDAMMHNVKHGVSIFPQVLQNETADALREFVLENKNTRRFPGIFVIEPENRFSGVFTIDEDPSILQAAKEIATHPILRPALEEILGRNPAVIEFSVINSAYGAMTQEFHADTDVEASAMKYGRTFAPSYSLFIPLQDTTGDMGATEVCPGSHVCHWDFPYCTTGRGSLQVSEGSSRDLWPRGSGALMNQQLQHRGRGHFDEFGGERVLVVISFAPRPRTGHLEVETRMVSLGSTFSIKTDHWGHTLDDYAEASSRMRQPWRTLRALGIYKPVNSEWGWDLLTMASMRLVNEAYGYYRHELDELIEKGGISFVPKVLQAEVTGEEGWHHYYMNTFENCKRALKTLNLCALGCFLACCSVFDGTSGRLFRKRTHGSVTMRSLKRILLTHGLAILAAHGLWVRLCNSTWATKVTLGKLYNLIGFDLENAKVAATLPSLPDALLETRYNSEYLGSYNHMLDVTHPGNRNFYQLVNQNSLGYDKLNPSLQRHLSSSILELQRLSGGRLLTQNDLGKWYEMSGERAIDAVHKELMKASNHFVSKVLTELEFLLSETKFGHVRDSAMYQRHTPEVLQSLKHRILYPTSGHVDHVAGTTRLVSIVDSSLSAMRRGLRDKDEQRELILLLNQLRSKLQQLQEMGTKPLLSSAKAAPSMSLPTISAIVVKRSASVLQKSKGRTLVLPPRHSLGEPYEGAWLAEGDLVDAKYQGRYDWYMARIVSADADSATYDVMHMDGEVDIGLRRGFIRPYSPPDVGELVEVRKGSDTYHQATVLHVNDDDTCVVQVHNSSMRRNVPLHFLRRKDRVYDEGSLVEVCQFYGRETDGYDDDDNWVPARIIQGQDGLYGLVLIGYAAGVQKDVPHERLRPYVR